MENPNTGAGNIKKFQVTNNRTGNSVDLSAGIVEYSFYENVLSNNITARAIVVETGNQDQGAQDSTIDGLPIRGGEKVVIEVEDATQQPITLRNPLRVNKIGKATPGTRQDVYVLELATDEYHLNEQTRVTKQYQGKISDNVRTILTEVLKTEEPLDIDETSLDINFFGNTKKPFYTVTWLASKSVPDTGVGAAAGYLFYQTRDGLFFKSIDKLFEQEPTKKFFLNDTQALPPGYDAKVLKYNIGSNIDLHTQQSIGAYNNRSIYFDFYAMNYKVVDFSIEEQEGKAKTAGPDYINVDEEFVAEPTRLYNHILDVGVNPPGSGDEQLRNQKKDPTAPNYKAEDTMVQTIMRYNQMFTVRADVIIPGDFTIKCGDIVQCDFPQLKGGREQEINRQSGGKYMVASVCHRITGKDTLTSLGLVRDSFGKEGGF